MNLDNEKSDSSRADLKVAALQRDVSNIHDLVLRVDTTLSKLADTTGSLAKLLAVQETRIATSERNTSILEQLIEKRTSELNTMDRELNVRISTVQQEIKRDFQEIEDRIMDGIKDLRDEIRKDLASFKEDKGKLEEKVSTIESGLNKRIENLEKWRWIIMGAGAAIGFFVSRVDLSALSNLIK